MRDDVNLRPQKVSPPTNDLTFSPSSFVYLARVTTSSPLDVTGRKWPSPPHVRNQIARAATTAPPSSGVVLSVNACSSQRRREPLGRCLLALMGFAATTPEPCGQAAATDGTKKKKAGKYKRDKPPCHTLDFCTSHSALSGLQASQTYIPTSPSLSWEGFNEHSALLTLRKEL